MMQGLYISSTGMITHSDGLGVIGNNLANVNTVGFKQQMMLFQDLPSEDLIAGAGYEVEVKQMGLGAIQGYTRTLFTEGVVSEGFNVTDLAIGGDGYFQVVDQNNEIFYTRAGNFFINESGAVQNPGGEILMGIPIEDGVEGDEMTEIVINTNDPENATNPPKATTTATVAMNLYTSSDQFSDPENPYFSMIQSWNGTMDPPISGVESNNIQYYDANGVKHSLQFYFDKVSSVDGKNIFEFTVAMDPSLDARAEYANTDSAGLLLSGTMTFTSNGVLENMNYFSPNGGDLTDPSGWSLSTLEDGLPSLSLTLAGQEAQKIQLNLGMKGGSDTWVLNDGNEAGNITAADIGKELSALPGFTTPTLNGNMTTSLATSTSLKNLIQDGYTEGDLLNMEIDTSGIVSLSYSNGQTQELYRIPLTRFTSEDGLRREGDNLYTYTTDAGAIEHGVAGTENYGKIYSNALEQSNVDTSREMVNMIVVQRGFQSSSKSLQSIDTMIQKAIEMKR